MGEELLNISTGERDKKKRKRKRILECKTSKISLTHRTIQVGEGLWSPSSSISCSKQHQTGHIAHGHVQLGFEYL